MASNKRTIYLGLDYSQFSGGITEINRKMGLLDAEFKLAAEQAKNYGTETDTLGLKQEYLAQKIELQKKKVEEAEKAYNQIMSTQGASQKEIDALDKKLLQERTTLEKLNGELKEEEEATKKADKANQSFGDELRNVASVLGMQASPAVEALASKFDGVSAAAGNAIIVIGALGKKLYDWAKDLAENADQLNTLSKETGIAVEELQRLEYASELIDVSTETLTSSMGKMVRTMDNARDGSKQAEEAFKKLGVRITDNQGHLLDQQETFYNVIDALGRVRSETERDAISMDIFGKSARELNPLIEEGSEKLKELTGQADQYTKIWSQQEINEQNQLNDAMYNFSETLDSLKGILAMSVIPVLTNLFDALAAIGPETLALIVKIGLVIYSIVQVVQVIKSLTDTGKAITSFFKTFDFSSGTTYLKILGLVAAVAALAIALSILFGKGKEVEAGFNSMGNSLSKVTNTVDDAATKSKYATTTARNASGTDNFAGGRTWVGEEGPELVTLPRGTKIEPTRESNKVEYNTFNITIDAKNVSDFTRVVELAKNQRMAERRV